MPNRITVAAAVCSALLSMTPSLAQTQFPSNQPSRGCLQDREANMQRKLNAAYNSGKLDSTELASFQRDFDGILVRESDFKNRTDGLTDSGRKTITKQLDVFEGRLSRQVSKSGTQTASDPMQSSR